MHVAVFLCNPYGKRKNMGFFDVKKNVDNRLFHSLCVYGYLANIGRKKILSYEYGFIEFFCSVDLLGFCGVCDCKIVK